MATSDFLDLSSNKKEVKTSLTGKVILGITGTSQEKALRKSLIGSPVSSSFQAVLDLVSQSFASPL